MTPPRRSRSVGRLRFVSRVGPVSRVGRVRRTLVALGLPLVLLAAGCTAPLPNITAFADGARVVVPPTLWCVADSVQQQLNCSKDAGAPTGSIVVPRGEGVSINVPADVGAAPWVVLFEYTNANGKPDSYRGPLQTERQLQYVLHPPQPTDQITRIEVQSGLTPVATDTGSGVDYAATRTWSIAVRPS